MISCRNRHRVGIVRVAYTKLLLRCLRLRTHGTDTRRRPSTHRAHVARTVYVHRAPAPLRDATEERLILRHAGDCLDESGVELDLDH